MEAYIMEQVRQEMEEHDGKRLAVQRDDAEDLCRICDIPYAEDGQRGHLLDIYYPKNAAGPLPVVIDIHGGGLFYAYKELNRYSNYEIARRGVALVSLSYRLLPEVRFADQLRDIMLALSKLPELAETYPLDLSRCSIMGDSAGGLLAYMAAVLTQNAQLRCWVGAVEPRVELRSVGLICIMLQTSDTLYSSLINEFIPNGSPADPYLLHPIDLASVHLPPVWLQTSEEDKFREETHMLYERLQTLGVPCCLTDHPKGEAHALSHVFLVCWPHYPESQADINSLCRFFDDPLSEIERIRS